MQNKIKEITAKCIEANPDILKLEFGCKVKSVAFGYENIIALCTDDKLIYCPKCDDNDFHYDHIEHVHNNKVQILGRDIRLADILLAIEKTKHYATAVDTEGMIIVAHDVFGFDRTGIKYNLIKDNLADQSEETISFLHDLLCIKPK